MTIRIGIIAPLDIETTEEDVRRAYACLFKICSDYRNNNDFGITVAARDHLGLLLANDLMQYQWHIGIVVEENQNNPIEEYHTLWIAETENSIHYGVARASNVLIVSHRFHHNTTIRNRIASFSRDGGRVYYM